MSSYQDKYQALNSARGNNVHDIRFNSTKQKIEKSFNDSLSYYDVFFNNDLTSRGVNIVDDSDSKEKKKIIVKPDGSLSVGDYISWDGSKWVVDLMDNMGDIYKRGTMQKCVSSLKWLNGNGNVREAHFAIDYDSTNIGIDEGKVLTLPNERRNIQIQNNSETNLLKKNQRFIFDKRVWKLTAINGLRDGILFLILEEDLFNVNDNRELRIADYWNNLHTYVVTINNGDSAQIHTGDDLQLTYTTFDTVNGKTITTPLPVIFSSSNPACATVSSTGLISSLADGNTEIKVELEEDNNIFDTISIEVLTVVTDNYAIIVNGSVDCKVGQSQTYTVYITNNGIVDSSKTVTWQIQNDAETGTTTLATITSSTDTSCIIKGNSNYHYGYIKLKATCLQDGSLIGVKRIQIKSLI